MLHFERPGEQESWEGGVQRKSLELSETADVSPIAAMNHKCKWRILFGSDRNRTQEADGSIPFSSTELLGFGVEWGRRGTIADPEGHDLA
jgi:hypothetical protein